MDALTKPEIINNGFLDIIAFHPLS